MKLDLESVEDIVPSFSDKIFHFLAYALFAWLWFNSFYFKFNLSKSKSILRSVLLSVGFGIIIEVLQLLLTTSRSFDMLDILANTLGVLFAAILINNKIIIDVKK
ncbi:VanZ family protein [Xanthomarina sp. F2636L]|uniref:VanZ family protein n=1 Tax=Xanthomarina sp. F2636L TaxID=2996018 RepID=UPI00225DDFF9|nr:VanZ family protein [Xanthomarina sp. F2636L]MCX7551663.1 VanZ family protein [Xanthomarina sp. F2636L]